jgi:GT2 family glycosyltransferase
MTTQDRIGVAITCYNDRAAVAKLLRGLVQQSTPVARVLIVDNSSSEGSFEEVVGCPSPEVQCFPENIGVSGALDVALRWSKEQELKWLWLFDQDSVPEANALERLLVACRKASANTNGLAMLAPLVVDASSGQATGGFHWHRGQFTPAADAKGSNEFECDAVINSGSLVKVDLVNEDDLPPRKLFIDGVDFLFCFNLRLRNLRILVVPEAKIHHRLGAPTLVKLPFRAEARPYFHLSPLRVFCICRNYTYLELKHSRLTDVPIVLIRRIKHCLYFIVGALWGADRKLYLIKMAILGTLFGVLGERYWPDRPPLIHRR